MKTFLKTLIGGALGLGALYVVGKVCFEAGKDVAEIERQLSTQTNDISAKPVEADADEHDDGTNAETAEAPVTTDTEEKLKAGVLDKAATKIRNAKMFLKLRKTFSREGKQPGVLSTLLNNPEGAKIEAFVMDGGVRINVRPRAA